MNIILFYGSIGAAYNVTSRFVERRLPDDSPPLVTAAMAGAVGGMAALGAASIALRFLFPPR